METQANNTKWLRLISEFHATIRDVSVEGQMDYFSDAVFEINDDVLSMYPFGDPSEEFVCLYKITDSKIICELAPTNYRQENHNF